MVLVLDQVTFTYPTATQPIFENIEVHFSTGWTGVIGANGTGKTTLLCIACNQLEPTRGKIRRPGRVVYCPQQTDGPPGLLDEFLRSLESDAWAWKGKLGIQDDWLIRWNTLSHGERKRAQIAVALWQSPDILGIDEPTNHIDREAKELLLKSLRLFGGIGLLVSHDRDLLDMLCYQCLVLDPPSVTCYPGGYSKAFHLFHRTEERVQKIYDQVKSNRIRIEREIVRRREKMERVRSKLSKRRLDPKDSDGRRNIDVARLKGVDAKAGKLSVQLNGRLAQMNTKLAGIQIKRRYHPDFWMTVSPAKKDRLFVLLRNVLKLGDGRKLSYPELEMKPRSRTALTGANGSGKTTLIRHILKFQNLPEEKIIYIPQEIDTETSRSIMSEINRLPNEKLGRTMTLVSCLGSQPERLVGNMDVSPGEIRKILLALGVSKSPYLIIMDEPTNHLDLPAIECLENALSGCPCGLLLVSHDERFLSRLTQTQWHISKNTMGELELKIREMKPRNI